MTKPSEVAMRAAENFINTTLSMGECNRLGIKRYSILAKIIDKHMALSRKTAGALIEALEEMDCMYEAMLKEANHGASFYTGKTIQMMNETPIRAQRTLTLAKKEMDYE